MGEGGGNGADDCFRLFDVAIRRNGGLFESRIYAALDGKLVLGACGDCKSGTCAADQEP